MEIVKYWLIINKIFVSILPTSRTIAVRALLLVIMVREQQWCGINKKVIQYICMSSLKSSAQQRHVLILGFTLLFSVSLAIILFKRVQKQESTSQSVPQVSLAANEVRGDEVIRDQAIARYHSQARQVAVLLFSNIAKLEQGQSAREDELAAARQAIINMIVPGVYQKLHFKLLKILSNLESGPAAPLDYLVEQRALLQEEWPWL